MDGRVFARKLNGFLLTPNEELEKQVLGLWSEDEIGWTVYGTGGAAIEALFNEPPDLLVVDNLLPDLSGAEVATLVKSENVYRQLPVVLCLSDADLENGLDFSAVEADDFIRLPLSPREARARVCLTLNRALRNLDANPLTRLPGNSSIIQRIQLLIDRQADFALAYVDLDFFKSFNDKYGFSRGDEVLRMTARLIVNIVRSVAGKKSFVGHVGGDDFVFLVPPGDAETVCQQIVESFDDIIPGFYDDEDRAKGGITSTDRNGNEKEFPLMSISLAVVFNRNGRLKHYGEASLFATGLKKKAKENLKSCYELEPF